MMYVQPRKPIVELNVKLQFLKSKLRDNIDA